MVSAEVCHHWSSEACSKGESAGEVVVACSEGGKEAHVTEAYCFEQEQELGFVKVPCCFLKVLVMVISLATGQQGLLLAFVGLEN